MNSLFGLELPTPVNLVVAFVVVLLLIGAATWLVRRFGATQLEAAARGRQPRLAIVDSAAVDARRKLVIIRRDNVEHLLMIGGPTDVVVETNIVRAVAMTAREPAVPRNGGAEPMPRAVPQPEPTPWPLQPEPAPAPAAAVRAERPPRAVADEPPQWEAPIEPATAPVAPAVRAARPADQLSGLAADMSNPASAPAAPAQRAAHPEPAHIAPHAAPPAAATANGVPGAPVSDQSLAEMAQRLEAALRRPAMQKPPAEAGTARVAIAADGKPTARAEPRAAVAQARGGAQPKPQPAANLEQEMASLLSRPGKT